MNNRDIAMNLKINNEVRRTSFNVMQRRKSSYLIKEERRRTGRFIAVLVGISLLVLAIYHAWVRRIPVVASLLVPALIMFVYVGWVLYTASRDKHRLLDMEAAMQAALDEENDLASCGSSQYNGTVVSSKASSKVSTPEATRKQFIALPPITCANWEENKQQNIEDNKKQLTKPIILINDVPQVDLDQKWDHVVQIISNNEMFKNVAPRTKFKRKFCRSRRQAVFKRSYSIA